MSNVVSLAAARRTPSLYALRAFEAAARHLSVSDAAKELAVSAGAVSQQIRLLEELAGGALLDRSSRTISLTELGAELYPILRGGFEHLQRACDLLERPASRRALVISAPETFSAKWLAPRLARFAAAHKGAEMTIHADCELSELSSGRVDVAIHLGRHGPPGFKADPILSADAVPVCSPALLRGAKKLRSPRDLAGHTLIHLKSNELGDASPSWPQWFVEQDIIDIDAHTGDRVEHCDIAIELAAHGRGVALMPQALVAEDLASGRLCMPFPRRSIENDLRYFVVTRQNNVSEAARGFVRWLIAESSGAEQIASGARV